MWHLLWDGGVVFFKASQSNLNHFLFIKKFMISSISLYLFSLLVITFILTFNIQICEISLQKKFVSKICIVHWSHLSSSTCLIFQASQAHQPSNPPTSSSHPSKFLFISFKFQFFYLSQTATANKSHSPTHSLVSYKSQSPPSSLRLPLWFLDLFFGCLFPDSYLLSDNCKRFDRISPLFSLFRCLRGSSFTDFSSLLSSVQFQFIWTRSLCEKSQLFIAFLFFTCMVWWVYG